MNVVNVVMLVVPRCFHVQSVSLQLVLSDLCDEVRGECGDISCPTLFPCAVCITTTCLAISQTVSGYFLW